jgi:glycerol uptake facilitator-like aquaporin
MFWRMGALDVRALYVYLCAQFSGAIAGVWLTHLMFGLPILQQADNARTGVGIWASELVSSLVLLSVIYLGVQYAKDKIAMLVALTVTGGYWFTSSTFFANPAVTVARSLSNTFVGIAPADVMGFIAAQLLAVLIVILIVRK